MKCEIIAVGSEMLTPYRQDTNSLYLTEKLNGIGVAVAYKSIVGDRLNDLVGAIRTALGRVDIVAIIGGLGPTNDDLTREAVAQALNLTLRRDPIQVAALHARAAQLRISMPSNNLKQAEVIEGALVMQNKNGSAPGQWLDTAFANYRKILFMLPGPPNECKALFEEECLPRIKAVAPPKFIATRVLKAAMISESKADELLAPIYTAYRDVETTILAHAGDIQLNLTCTKSALAVAQARVDELALKLEDALGEWMYSANGESLEQILMYYLGIRQATLAVAESCTGGMIAERITSVAGSSLAFAGGVVAYSNSLKSSFLGVEPELINRHGSVSAEVARAMAEGMRQRTNATLALGVTGIAGPSGGSPDKPVGLVYIALTDQQGSEVIERKFTGDRERVRQYATLQAMDMVRRKLM
jgi:nicotinamide-nucleotide amidase